MLLFKAAFTGVGLEAVEQVRNTTDTDLALFFAFFSQNSTFAVPFRNCSWKSFVFILTQVVSNTCLDYPVSRCHTGDLCIWYQIQTLFTQWHGWSHRKNVAEKCLCRGINVSYFFLCFTLAYLKTWRPWGTISHVVTFVQLVHDHISWSHDGKHTTQTNWAEHEPLPEFVDPGMCCRAARNIFVEMSKNYRGEKSTQSQLYHSVCFTKSYKGNYLPLPNSKLQVRSTV